MPKFNKIHQVNHRASEMYDLVADIERYPDFVPMCDQLVIRSRRGNGERERIMADMSVAYKFIRESFTSQVTLDKSDLEIDVEYIDGPFRYLENQWRFVELDDNCCEIHFTIDYEFKSRALGLLLGSLFEKVFSKFTQAFEKRADEIYGKNLV
ncbi:MAG: type II toxin-antitoxin system RatA family toxin [Hyphomicrobiales bacterium]|nr:type II toxin-antitoxin system RatA family toxin [Hyphomicrobiales bacterium]